MENAVRTLQEELDAATVGIVLLALLERAERPLYGHQIAQRLEARSGGGGTVKHGTLHPALRALEARRLVSCMVEPSGPGPARRYYALTERGRRELALGRDAWRRTRDLVEAALEGDDDA